jgi:hypothetical protein
VIRDGYEKPEFAARDRISKSASADPPPFSSSSTTTMSYSMPPPPPGMVPPPPGMPLPPPGMPHSARPSGSRLPPEVLTLKSQKWIQMQKRRYGEKRTAGYVDMGKQVCELDFYDTGSRGLTRYLSPLRRICPRNTCEK